MGPAGKRADKPMVATLVGRDGRPIRLGRMVALIDTPRLMAAASSVDQHAVVEAIQAASGLALAQDSEQVPGWLGPRGVPAPVSIGR